MPVTPESKVQRDELVDAVRGEFSETPDATNPARELLRDHFGADPGTLATAADNYLPIVGVHLQAAVEQFINAPGRVAKLHGFAVSSASSYERISLEQLLAPPTLSWSGPTPSSPDYVQQETSEGRRTVLRRGLYLVNDEEGPAALWVSKTAGDHYMSVEVMAPTEERAQAIITGLRVASYQLNPFKGQFMTLRTDCPGNVVPEYLERPRYVSAADVILPDGLLDRIEEHAMGVGDNRDDLLEVGHSLKRGLLLYGPPGTGKTHIIRYLVSKMTDYTVVSLPASRMMWMVDRIAEVLPYITPGILIFDDVDLIAEDRSNVFTTGNRGPLFSLLELMDGIGAETDLLFILTTNVPDRLEEAIAARPGRVDQAFEVPRPDASARKRLFELGTEGIKTEVSDFDTLLARTEGVTASFIKELVRRATVVAALESADDDNWDDDDDVTITDAAVSKALDQLLDPDNQMTAQLLGAEANYPKMTLGHVASALHNRRSQVS